MYHGNVGQKCVLRHGAFHVVTGRTAGNDVVRLVASRTLKTIDPHPLLRGRNLVAVVAMLCDEILKKCKVKQDGDIPLLCLLEKLPPAISLTTQSTLMLRRLVV